MSKKEFKKPKVDFIGIGVPRGGTTWLHKVLSFHLEVRMSNPKETYFFNDESHYQKGFKHYARAFSANDSEAIIQGEVTPGYFSSEEALERIKEHYPDSKIIVILRDPIERAYSHYLYQRNKGVIQQNVGFYDYVTRYDNPYIKQSLYADDLKRAKRLFGDSLLVLLHDDLQRDSMRIFERVCSFLGIEKSKLDYGKMGAINGAATVSVHSILVARLMYFLQKKLRNMKTIRAVLRKLGLVTLAVRIKKANKYYSNNAGLKKEKLDSAVRMKLLPLFLEDIKETEKIINRDLTKWRTV